LEITLDKHAANEASIKIKLIEADYRPKVDSKIKDYAKKATIKGFRPGKAPVSMIKNLYGTSVLVEEINQILSTSLNEYIKEQPFKVIGDPLPQTESVTDLDWKKQKEFEFSYKIGFVDRVDIDLESELDAKTYKVELSDKEIDDALTNIKRQYGKMTNPDISEGNDFLYGDLKAVDGSFEKTLSLPLSKLDESSVNKFIGVEKGAVIEFDPSEAIKSDMAEVLSISEEEAAAVSGEFTFTVQNINRTEEAELNQELFDKVFGPNQVTSEEDFLNKIKEILTENYNKEMKLFSEEEIKKALIEKASIDLPEKFLKEWLVKTNNNKLSEEEVEKEFPAYANQLIWSLISNTIAEQNDIKAEQSEVIEKTKEMIRGQFGSSGMSMQLEENMDLFVNNYLQGNEGQNYMQMLTAVQNEKVIAFVKEKTSPKEEVITVEKFNELLEN
jgi:trigger factor